MTSNQTARLIGAIFGLVFVQANAGALPPAAAVPLRVLGIAAFIGLFIALRRARVPEGAAAGGTTPRTFGRGYRYVVAAEVLLLAAGLFVIARLLHSPQAAVGWIALVVGLHFFGLAAVWRMASVRLPAAAMSACGAAGLALAACGAPPAVIAVVAGIVPGAVLFGSVWWSLRAGRPQAAARA
ncbi:hypothetical protein ACGFYU_16410 [Streptomyces sp. NPDC048337]|uniref:hypothetical protein n=1 Tax=Streptomyces sp. NPDC048337 TaxID=3365535 RepID=UPI0037246F75